MQNSIKKSKGHKWAGLLLLVIGATLLFRALGVDLPYWLFRWPVIVIIAGLFIGSFHGFRNPGWIIIVSIGLVFLMDLIVPDISLGPFIAPVAIIILGLFIMLRSKRHSPSESYRANPFENQQEEQEIRPAGISVSGTNEFVEITSIFGGTKKIILSKNFKGGELVNIMGGTELNLSQADFSGSATIDSTIIFGGVKLVIPSSWDLQSEVVTIFGGVDDKRQINAAAVDPNKVLRLEGTCIFGGIEIRNF